MGKRIEKELQEKESLIQECLGGGGCGCGRRREELG